MRKNLASRTLVLHPVRKAFYIIVKKNFLIKEKTCPLASPAFTVVFLLTEMVLYHCPVIVYRNIGQ